MEDDRSVAATQAINTEQSLSTQSISRARRWFKSYLTSEIALALLLGVVSFLIAWKLQGGRHINWRAPLVYDGDGLFYLATTKRIAEGTGYLINSRQGFPFSSYLFDFPGSDGGSLLALWLAAKVTGSAVVANNSYYMTGFPLAAISAFWAMRHLSVSKQAALVFSLLFSVIPFHFLRLGHLYYTWYFVIPLYSWLAFKLHNGGEDVFGATANWTKRLLFALAFVFLACFGVYYAAFGCIALSIGAALGALKQRSYRPAAFGLVAVLMVAAGVAINVAPNAMLVAKHGSNDQIASRTPAESEVFGLKISQLLLPRPAHRNELLGEINSDYAKVSPHVNENSTASLGFVGSIGFFVLLISAVVLNSKGPIPTQVLHLFGVICLAMVLVATSGGFSSIFANLVTPQIRAWNRISVFIAFIAFVAVGLVLDRLIEHYRNSALMRLLTPVLFGAIAVFGIWDQTVVGNVNATKLSQAQFVNDATFFRDMEKSLPEGAAVYQLPFMTFPEAPSKYQLSSYDPARGFLHTRRLKWSFGVAAGREGNDFLEDLASRPIPMQLEIARFLGFSAVLLQKSGYGDKGAKIIAELSSQLKLVSLGTGPNDYAYFPLQGDSTVVDADLLSSASKQFLAQWGLQRVGDQVGFFPAPAFYELDFTKSLKYQLKSVKGMSTAEPWGTWSDEKIITLKFKRNLPRNFTLQLLARGYGPNSGKPVEVRVGSRSATFTPTSEMQSFAIPFFIDTDEDSIQLTVPNPTTPQQLGAGNDIRPLGLGFVSISVK